MTPRIDAQINSDIGIVYATLLCKEDKRLENENIIIELDDKNTSQPAVHVLTKLPKQTSVEYFQTEPHHWKIDTVLVTSRRDFGLWDSVWGDRRRTIARDMAVAARAALRVNK